MKQILILSLIVFSAACGGSSPNTNTDTSMQGTWTVTGKLSSGGTPPTYQVKLVSSPCTVTTSAGTFSVQGTVCFIANNNSAQGSIVGGSTTAKSAGQGVLVGVAANPVPANGTFNMVFVAGDGNGNIVEFTGSGTVSDSTLTGSASCSSTTPLCQNVSGTFTGSLQ